MNPNDDVPSALADFPICVRIPVAWGEMDAFGHINNVVYFRYCESARIAYLERIGLAAPRDADGIGPILASASCRFRQPLVYPDTVLVGAQASDVSVDRFTMQYRIVSERTGAVVADSEGVVVAFNYEVRRKATLPEDVRGAIAWLERDRRD